MEAKRVYKSVSSTWKRRDKHAIHSQHFGCLDPNRAEGPVVCSVTCRGGIIEAPEAIVVGCKKLSPGSDQERLAWERVTAEERGGIPKP